MNRDVVGRLLVAGMAMLCGTRAVAGKGWLNQPVQISEVCVKPPTVLSPRWVELRSFATNDVNLKGYALHDRSSCFFKFEDDCVLRAGGLLTLYFYSWGDWGLKSGVEYDGGQYPARIVVTNAIPFSGKANWVASDWKLARDAAWLRSRFRDLTIEQYGYLERVAAEQMKREGFRDAPKEGVMWHLMRLYFESDEIALLDAKGRLADFVGWGGGRHLEQPARSKWEQAAKEQGFGERRLWIDRVRGESDIFAVPHITLSRRTPGYYARVLFGTPERVDGEATPGVDKLALKVDKESGTFTVEARSKAYLGRSRFIVEMSVTPDFQEICHRQTEMHWQMVWHVRGKEPFGMELELSDEQIRELCKHPRWYYRARREFEEDAPTEWFVCESPVMGNVVLGEFGSDFGKMAAGLIERRKAWRERREREASGAASEPGPDAKPE